MEVVAAVLKWKTWKMLAAIHWKLVVGDVVGAGCQLVGVVCVVFWIHLCWRWIGEGVDLRGVAFSEGLSRTTTIHAQILMVMDRNKEEH